MVSPAVTASKSLFSLAAKLLMPGRPAVVGLGDPLGWAVAAEGGEHLRERTGQFCGGGEFRAAVEHGLAAPHSPATRTRPTPQ